MEIKQGIVRNYVVTDREKFCDAMARALCQMQISYVQIDNEFHFNDKIYRFYNFGEVIELTEQVSFVCLDREKDLSLSPCDLLFSREQDTLESLDHFGGEVSTGDFEYENTKHFNKVFTKKDIKLNSKIVNNKIKNSHRQPVYKIRRTGY